MSVQRLHTNQRMSRATLEALLGEPQIRVAMSLIAAV